MQTYFPHFLNAEYATLFGPQPAGRLVDHHLKSLALLGARISVGGATIADSASVQRVVTNAGFRKFVMNTDRGFLRLEVDGDPVTSDREWVARHAWRRMQESGWVSSSDIGQYTMVAAAEAALDTTLGDMERFKHRVEKIAHDSVVPDHARKVLTGTFELLSWFGIDDESVAKATTVSPTTYYDKIIAALAHYETHYEQLAMTLYDADVRKLKSDLDTLRGVKRYLDDHLENRWARSDVLTSLSKDSTIESRLKSQVRATVASAWTAAISDGSSATVNLTFPLPVGILIPRVLETPMEALGRGPEIDDVVHESPLMRLQDSLRLNVARMSWEEVAEIVKETEETRRRIVDCLDRGTSVEEHLIRAHRLALNDRVKKRYPRVKLKEGVIFASTTMAAVQTGAPPSWIAASAAGGTAVSSVWEWTRGRFLAATVNRAINKLQGDSPRA